MFSGLFGDNDEAGGETGPTSSSSFMGTGTSLKTPPAARGHFVGLRNQGATCYLNSLLQSMYMTPELRDGLNAIDPLELGAALVEEQAAEEKPVGGGEVVPNESFLASLMEWGLSESHAKKSLILTKNAGVMEAFDYYSAHSEDAIYKEVDATPDPKKSKKKKPRLIPLELQNLFCKLQLVNENSISTESLTTKGFQWTGMDGGIQHDAHELNRLLIDALEKSLKGTSGSNLCQDVYRGELAYVRVCQTCGNESRRAEQFYDVNLQIMSCPDLFTSFYGYCTPEIMDLDNQIFCDNCACKRDVIRRVSIESVPPVLIISLNRFKIDRSTNWQREKIVDRSEFPLFFNMSSFLGINENISPNFVDDTYLNDLKDNQSIRLNEIYDLVLALSADLVDKYDTDDLSQLSEHFDMINGALLSKFHSILGSSGSNSASSSASSSAAGNALYQLQSVIMHQGSAHSGHYFAYINDARAEGHWLVEDQVYSSAQYEKTSKKEIAKAARNKQDPYFFQPDMVVAIDASSIIGKFVKYLQEKACDSKSFVLKNDFLELVKKDGQTWIDHYKPQYGELSDFLSKNIDLIDIEKKGPKYRLKRDVVIDFFEHEVYSKKFENFKVERAESGVDADEEFARALQDSLNAEREAKIKEKNKNKNNKVDVSTSTTTATTTDSASENQGWTEVTSKSGGKSKENSSSDHVATENIPHPPLPPPTSEADLVEQRLVRVRKLAESIVARVCGKFFEFNDSSVTPMLTKDVERAFEGTKSAYLLVYRRVETLPLLTPLDSSSISSSFSLQTPPLPHLYWVDKVKQMNDSLEVERKMFEHLADAVGIHIKCPSHLLFEAPILLPKQCDELADTDMRDGVTLKVRRNQPIKEILALFKDQYESHLSSLGIFPVEEKKTSGGSNSKQNKRKNKQQASFATNHKNPSQETKVEYILKFSVLQKHANGGFYIDSNIGENTLLSEVTSGASLLIWNGKDINGEEIANSCVGAPISYSICMLAPKGDFSVNGERAVDKIIEHPSVLFEHDVSIESAISKALSMCSLEPAKSVLHVVLRSATDGSYATKLLWNKHYSYKGSVTAWNGVQTRSQKASGGGSADSGAGGGDDWRLLRDITGGCEFLIEDIDSKGTDDSFFLAEKDVIGRSSSVKTLMTIDMTLSFLRRFEINKSSLKYDNFDRDILVERHVSRMDTFTALKRLLVYDLVMRSSNVYDNKEKIESLIEMIMQETRLRTGEFKGDGLIEDESAILELYHRGRSPGSTFFVCLEEGPLPLTDTVVVTISSSSFEFADQLGEISPSCAETVVDSRDVKSFSRSFSLFQQETIKQARERIGRELFAFPDSWTAFGVTSDHDENLFVKKRPIKLNEHLVGGTAASELEEKYSFVLHKSNFAFDLEYALDEVDGTGKEKLVSSLKLQHGSVLLLEKGDLPRQRCRNYQFYIWTGDPELTSQNAAFISSGAGNGGGGDRSAIGNSASSDLNDSQGLSPRTLMSVDHQHVLDKFSKLRSSFLFSIGTINSDSTLSLRELYGHVDSLMKSQSEYIRANCDVGEALFSRLADSTVDSFVLRDINQSDLLPAKNLWLPPLPSESSSSTSSAKSSPNNKNQPQKKKVDIATLTPIIAIQFLSLPQNLYVPPPTSFSLWIQALANSDVMTKKMPESPDEFAVMAPFWPPKEIRITGNTTAILKRAISDNLGLPFETTHLFKYSRSKLVWDYISMKNLSQKIMESPLFLKDGELICAFNGKKLDVTTISSFQILRYEDKVVKLLKDAALAAKKQKKDYGHKKDSSTEDATTGKTAKSKPRRVEIALSIGGDLNFSSDEEEKS